MSMDSAFLCLRRGVSDSSCLPWRNSQLFSAYAEVFLTLPALKSLRRAFLCLRRGVSNSDDFREVCVAFLCLRRGVSTLTRSVIFSNTLFSAYAEVFPSLPVCPKPTVSFSLPTQRCFPLGRNKKLADLTFLCLRRGVSSVLLVVPFSVLLFSAYAEVFPLQRR